ncbi:molybdenum cofactor biosynthesis protein MoaE [Hyphobacterium sp.]|uniref:molybdenum cofactor biosynthesis protein MoaE n=1 Tax=Hyphobacterium sp. TaxID=2004662 RepID=UPI0037489495
MMSRFDALLTPDPLDLAGLNTRLPIARQTGATASFTGYVRGENGLSGLELLAHPVLTQAALTQIAEDATRRFELTGLLIAHRHGRMQVGEPIVHIIAAAAHRRAALEAVSFVIDVLKTGAPFWKREWRGDTYQWIEPTPDDHDKAAQWLGETNDRHS